VNDNPGSFPYAARNFGLLFVLVGGVVALGLAVWCAGLTQRRTSRHERDPELLETLLTSTSRDEVSDGIVYLDRASARRAARAYREPCRWRGFRFHYRVESVEGGYMWSAWADPSEESPEEQEDHDA
jgi:hypothetical protein